MFHALLDYPIGYRVHGVAGPSRSVFCFGCFLFVASGYLLVGWLGWACIRYMRRGDRSCASMHVSRTGRAHAGFRRPGVMDIVMGNIGSLAAVVMFQRGNPTRRKFLWTRQHQHMYDNWYGADAKRCHDCLENYQDTTIIAFQFILPICRW